MRSAHPRHLVVAAISHWSAAPPAPRRRSARPPWVLVYDGRCRMCAQGVDVIRRWDRAGHVVAIPFQDANAWAGMAGLRREALERAMHLVSPTGRVFAGAAAARPLLALLPGGRILAAPLGLPLAERVAAAGYDWIARHRHLLGCGSRECHCGD